MIRFAFYLTILLLSAQVGLPAHAGIVGVDLGTATPPTTLGGYLMGSFPADNTPLGSSTTTLPTPNGGSLGFSPVMTHEKIGQGWATWSNGYTGDVYTTVGTTLTITLPANIAAFIFYAEPEEFTTFTISAVSGGTTLSQSVSGTGGAAGFGYYGTAGSTISSISITSGDPLGFAVGEFSSTIAVPEPASIGMISIAGLMFLAHGFRRHRRANAA